MQVVKDVGLSPMAVPGVDCLHVSAIKSHVCTLVICHCVYCCSMGHAKEWMVICGLLGTIGMVCAGGWTETSQFNN